MSFSFDVKEDILKLNLDASSHLVELEGWLRLVGEVYLNPLRLVFSSTNLHILRYYVGILKQLYSNTAFEIVSKQQQNLNRKTIYSCIIESTAETIIEDINLLEPISIHKEEILNDQNKSLAYLRGVFLAKGSVNNPNTSNYHLEISTDKELEALFIQRLMNLYNLNARIVKRRNHLIVYIKEKDCIVEFLRRIGANVTMNEFENEIIKREISANINRTLNTDVANQQKTNRSSAEQMKYITYLEYHYPLERLDAKLLLVMKVRKENPEASLNELVYLINERYNEQITKSGLNHRFRKIKEIALDYKARKEA
ncbi:MAG: DNA-binding protein WhiA [Roseburia sp.]|nr:DNA-binding protein WhiA [Anaeroplasma bactoclasticum]MCM1195631.1 DNA-binding protein WhiA [Roseburia sp.]MCM1556624.1 DNA-binding protein WhiA [Anaeroplasma bactoclasticum]